MTDLAVGDIEVIRRVREPAMAGLRTLQQAGDAAMDGRPPAALKAAQAAADYLYGTLLPLSRAEELALFITVDGVIGAPRATAVMIAQHHSLDAMAGDLRSLIAAASGAPSIEPYRKGLATLLYALYGLARGHLEAEDDAYIGLLDGTLSESQVGSLASNLERLTSAQTPAKS
ncbi:MAG: hemerythrin domain-containing protein [Dehalococcoidia bacterium]